MPAVNSLIKVKAHFTYGSQGWVESYFMKGSNYAEVETNFNQIMNYRQYFMADGVKIVYVVAADVFIPRKTKLFVGSPRLSGANMEPGEQIQPHDVESCVRLRMETPLQAHTTRLIRGIADEDISNHINNYYYNFRLLETMPAEVPANITRAQAWDSFVNLLVHHTVYATKALAPAGQMITENWLSAKVRGVSNRKTGAPHGLTRGRKRKKKEEVVPA